MANDKFHTALTLERSGIMTRLGLYSAACVIVLMLNFGAAKRIAGGNAQDEQIKSDITQFQSYLQVNKPGKKWQTGPSRIDSEEIRKAYGNLRFYYVYSSPPMPPGAPLPELLEEYERKMD